MLCVAKRMCFYDGRRIREGQLIDFEGEKSDLPKYFEPVNSEMAPEELQKHLDAKKQKEDQEKAEAAALAGQSPLNKKDPKVTKPAPKAKTPRVKKTPAKGDE